MGAEMSAEAAQTASGQQTSGQQNTTTYEPDPNLQRTLGIPCIVCGEDALWIRDTCSQCKEAQYCSEACKATDARFHKLLCTSLKYFTEPPNNSYRRAIVFDYNSNKPRFVWIPVKTVDGAESPEHYLATLIEGEVGCIPIDTNAVRGRVLQNRITVYFGKDENVIKRGNECVAAVVKAAKPWDGMTESST
jgi:hypothetical protein